jgi:protein-S-isoprenylcysteine O-methyltransferase Ste14
MAAPTSDVNTGSSADLVVHIGGWLFKQRSWLPIPIVLALLLIPPSEKSRTVFWTGILLVALGEWLRLWAVHHIGAVSRTRSERLGPLISSGPFGYVRNPLYLGNIALWVGFSISAGPSWMAPVVLALLVLEYHAIVRWEEGLLASRLGEPYKAYVRTVPRWIPSGPALARQDRVSSSWRDTLFSERSTLIAVSLGYALLWLKR